MSPSIPAQIKTSIFFLWLSACINRIPSVLTHTCRQTYDRWAYWDVSHEGDYWELNELSLTHTDLQSRDCVSVRRRALLQNKRLPMTVHKQKWILHYMKSKTTIYFLNIVGIIVINQCTLFRRKKLVFITFRQNIITVHLSADVIKVTQVQINIKLTNIIIVSRTNQIHILIHYHSTFGIIKIC